MSLALQHGDYHVIVVMPCYNEEEYIEYTCNSLGFGLGSSTTPVNAYLIIINNNSTDATENVANKIKANSASNTVYVLNEDEKGFVPARHQGNVFARQLAKRNEWNLDEVLILQVDADTKYSNNYIHYMHSSMQVVGRNTIIEACISYAEDVMAEYSAYFKLLEKVDNRFALVIPCDPTEDIIVDDKVAGYLLDDYFHWGGHRREFLASGDEVFAETTRLFIKAKAYGASKAIVNDTIALHSIRKMNAKPGLHFATAGFPREQSWNEKWIKTHNEFSSLSEFCNQLSSKSVIIIKRERELHILALLYALPLHIQRTIGIEHFDPNTLLSKFISFCLPKRSPDDLLQRPAIFISDIFLLIQLHGEALLTTADTQINNQIQMR